MLIMLNAHLSVLHRLDIDAVSKPDCLPPSLICLMVISIVSLLLIRVWICGHAHRHGTGCSNNSQRARGPAQSVSYHHAR